MSSFDTPEGRLALIEAVGVEEYNRQFQEHHKRSVVEVCNGHPIRRVNTPRWGTIFMVDGLERGGATLEHARAIARGEI